MMLNIKYLWSIHKINHDEEIDNVDFETLKIYNRYLETWINGQKKAKEDLANNISELIKSRQYVIDTMDKLFEEINILSKTKKHPLLVKYNATGSLVDSEQAFLVHDYFKETIKNTKEKIIEITKQHPMTLDAAIDRLIIHIHTTREMCKFCAQSMSLKLNKLKEENKNINVNIFVSYGQAIDAEDNDIRPAGVEKLYRCPWVDESEQLFNFFPSPENLNWTTGHCLPIPKEYLDKNNIFQMRLA